MIRASRIGAQLRRFGCTRPRLELRVDSPLSQGEVDASQGMRTVSKVTPGKWFMANFIAGEQSIMSIANRVNSVILVVAAAALASLYYGGAIEYSWVTPTILVYLSVSMHYHVGSKLSVPLAALCLLFFVYKCHIEQA